jgi:hypothetical protein
LKQQALVNSQFLWTPCVGVVWLDGSGLESLFWLQSWQQGWFQSSDACLGLERDSATIWGVKGSLVLMGCWPQCLTIWTSPQDCWSSFTTWQLTPLKEWSGRARKTPCYFYISILKITHHHLFYIYLLEANC